MFKNYKNILFSLITFLTIILLIELGIRILIEFKKHHLFQTEQNLNFYKKYINSLNHMRDASNNPKNAHNYLFNYLLKKERIRMKMIQYYSKVTPKQSF